MAFESIPHERKQQCSLGVKTAFVMVSTVTNCEETLDTMITLQCEFVK